MLVPAHLVVFLWLSCGDVLQAAGRAVLNFQTEEFQGGKLLRGVVFRGQSLIGVPVFIYIICTFFI